MKRLWLILLPPIFALAVAACGDSAGEIVPPTAVKCEAVAALDSYHYSTHTRFSVTDTGSTATPANNDLPPFDIVWDVEADVTDGGDKLQADVMQRDAGSEIPKVVISIGEDDWIQTNNSGYFAKLAGAGGSSVPFRPEETCRSLARDLRLAGLTATQENVNEIRSVRYDLADFPSAALADLQSIGSGADAVTVVDSYSGAVWVTEDGYISKLDLSGEGEYEGGRRAIAVELQFEYSGVNDTEADIVEPEPGAPPAP